jgi:myo-inositol 2-dehydrogenase / D-chiro-inositol 1-dehydrogenase
MVPFQRRERGQPVIVGVIGCGWVTENRHLPTLQDLPEVRIAAVAEINPERLKRVADRFQIRRRYLDFSALLDDSDIDAVAVCVPAEFHAEVALAALDAGKHVFIEKPLTLNLEESERLIARAAQSPRKVMVGFNLRWHRLVRQAREMIQRGTLGRPESIRTVFTNGIRYSENQPGWKKRRASGGGALFDQAVHHFDLWRFLLQSEVEEVFATSRSGEWEDETATVTARMANGVLATSLFSELTSDSNEIEIYGRAGRLRLCCYRFDGLEFFSISSYPGDFRTRMRGMAHTLKELPQGALKMRQGGDYVASYRAEWRHLIDSILRGTPVECTLEDGRRALQVVLAALSSASVGKPVKIAHAPRKITPTASDMRVESQPL